MNLTILGLTLLGAGFAPSVGLGKRTAKWSLCMRKLNGQRGFGHVILSDPTNTLRLEDSKFRSFLNTVVRVADISADGVFVKRYRTAIYDEAVHITNTFFLDCRCLFADGGAIFSVTATILKNCYFEGCQAEQGGALVAGPESTIRSTTFRKCIGRNQGGCVAIFKADRLSMSFCAFSTSAANNAGAILIRESDYTRLEYSNFSSCAAMKYCGALAIAGNFSMYFAIIDQCMAKVGVGGVSITAVRGFSIDFVLCLMVKSEGEESHSGVCVEARFTEGECLLKQCSFVGTQRIAGYSVFVDGSSGNFKVVLSSCCFQFPGDYFVANDEFMIPDDAPLVKGDCANFLKLVLPGPIGCQLALQTIPARFVEKVLTNQVIDFMQKEAVPLLVLGGVIGTAVSFLLFKSGNRKNEYMRLH